MFLKNSMKRLQKLQRKELNMTFTEKLTEIPVLESIAVAIAVIKAAMNGVNVKGMIAKEAGAFLPALA